MAEIAEVRSALNEARQRLITLGTPFDLPSKKHELASIESRMNNPSFWENPALARDVLTRAKYLKGLLEPQDDILSRLDAADEMLTLAADENETSIIDDIGAEASRTIAEIDSLELKLVLSGKYDPFNAYLAVQAGAGGTESCDWAAMLVRMYSRYAESRGWKVKLVDSSPNEEAGFRSATLFIEGDFVYGYLFGEIGVHRLVRISPFDANHRRHTSFASVDITPEVEDREIEIDPADLRIETHRSSGAGGQHVNMTDSAVRIIHVPSGIVVNCQDERSQHRNRDIAMKILRSRLVALKEKERQEELASLSGEKALIAWGSQIRSYVLQPYQMVKDLRTSCETSQADDVLNGKLDPFIRSFLRWRLGRNQCTMDGRSDGAPRKE
ncbi:MAG: peptide chain release factor 2 [Planctomycetes bacterium]|nr:peptide chain release factor 2 [Planctomycetota bacterium]